MGRVVTPFFDLCLLLILLVLDTPALERLSSQASAIPDDVGLFDISRPQTERRLSATQEGTVEGDPKPRKARTVEPDGNVPSAYSRNAASQAADDALSVGLDEEARLRAELAKKQPALGEYERERGRFEDEEHLLDDARRDVAQLDGRLRQLQERNRVLCEEVAAIKRSVALPSALRVEGTPLADAATALRPVYVVLANANVAPLHEPFYVVRQDLQQLANGRFATVFEATKKSAGEPADTALEPGSTFRKLLEEVRPGEQYVVLLVDQRSFGTFRTVREELRTRKIPFGWEPLSDTETLRLSASGQVVSEDIAARPERVSDRGRVSR